MLRLFLIACLLFAHAPAQAEVVAKACNSSSRPAATRALCGCIQDAASLTLSAREQRQAAEFFRNPEKAQKARTADGRSRERFWENYRGFIEVAEAYCADISD